MHGWADLGVTFHNIPADQKAPLQIYEERRAARAQGWRRERGRDGWTLEGRAQPELWEVGTPGKLGLGVPPKPSQSLTPSP